MIMTKHLNFRDYQNQKKTLMLSCDCGWKGYATEAFNDYYEEVMDFECPKCDKMLLIVNLIADT
ncbi:hypothetical protein GCM10022260_23870 [Gaetbulibacter aestuarii]